MVIHLHKASQAMERRIGSLFRWAEKEDQHDTEESIRLKQEINAARWFAWEQRFGVVSAEAEKSWVSDSQLVSMTEDGPRLMGLLDPDIKSIYQEYAEAAKAHIH